MELSTPKPPGAGDSAPTETPQQGYRNGKHSSTDPDVTSLEVDLFHGLRDLKGVKVKGLSIYQLETLVDLLEVFYHEHCDIPLEKEIFCKAKTVAEAVLRIKSKS